MACNCNELDYKCMGVKTSTDCVDWLGDAVPDLDICPGNNMTCVTQSVIDRLLALIAQVNAPLDIDLSTCPEMFSALAGKDPEVDNLLQVLWTNQCTLRTLINTIAASIPTGTGSYAFQLKCVTPVGAANDPNAIIQGLINSNCALEAQVGQLGTNIDDIIDTKVGDFIGKAIKSLGNRGIQKTGTGASTVYNFLALVPPYCPIPYVGPLNNFDGQGKGVVGTSYEGWYLLNGNFGLMDARGRTLVASLNGVPGATLDAAVDPNILANAGTNYTNGAKFGSSFYTLSLAQTPSHVHSITDVDHDHPNFYTPFLRDVKGGGNPDIIFEDQAANYNRNNSANPGNPFVGKSKTGITGTNATGGGQAHENRQPSLAVTGYIMRID
jgi:microcystin-dependent protein